MMAVELGVFFFVLLGSKIALGAVAVYMLIPFDDDCAVCDAPTLPLEHARGTGRVLRLLRLRRRWCMECRREALTRVRAATVAGRADSSSNRALRPAVERSRPPWSAARHRGNRQ
jgi:hypothetical protein